MPVPPSITAYTSETQQARLTLEVVPGEVLLLPETVGSGSFGLTTQPNSGAAGMKTTGAHLHFYIIGNSGSGGTIVIAGTGLAGALTSQTYHIPAAPQNQQGYTEFTTSEAFLTVTASTGITDTISGAHQVIVYGCPASKYLVPVVLEAEEVIPKYSPPDKRGILFKNIRVVQLTKGAKIDKMDAALYSGQSSIWIPYMLISTTPTVATLPTSATSLLASTPVSSFPTALTTQPKAPGQTLIFTIGGNSATGTIVIPSGSVDNYGNVTTGETITVGANNQTLYSTRRYSSINGNISTTGMTGAATIVITGAFGFLLTWLWDGLTNLTPYSATWEFFNGVFGVCLPYTILTQGDFDWQKDKEIKFSGKGEAQDFLLVGDQNPATFTGGTNPFATLAQPTDNPWGSWPATFFLDTLPGTPGTTQTAEFLTFKYSIMNGQKPFYVGDGMQRWSNVTRDMPDFTADATVILQHTQEYFTYYKSNTPFVGQAQFQGNWLGSLSSTSYYEYWQFTFPAIFDTYKIDTSKNPVEATAKIMSRYDYGLGYGYQLAVATQFPPVFPK